MDFALSDEQQRIREAIAKVCARFPDEYWLKRDREGGFPSDFHQVLARAGWLGVAMPEEFGGAGLGILGDAFPQRVDVPADCGQRGA